MVKFDKGASLKLRAYVRTLFELIFHNTPIYAVDRQPLFCTFCARAQNDQNNLAIWALRAQMARYGKKFRDPILHKRWNL